MTQWENLITIAVGAFREPRKAATDLARLDIPRSVLGPAFIVVMIISVLVTEPMLALLPPEVFGAPVPPFTRAIISIIFNLALVWVIWRTATGVGGLGSFDRTLLVFIFLEAVLSLGIAVLLLLLLALPTFAGLAGVAFFGYWVFLIGVFFSEAHGFASPLKGIGVVALAWVITYVALIVFMKLVFGIGGGAPNV